MKFKVGGIYKDREGREYKFIAYVPEAIEESQLIFMGPNERGPNDRGVNTRYLNGNIYSDCPNNYDIIPPEKKTVKLYPALFKKPNGGYFFSDSLYETKPENSIRLVTDYPPVIIEVDE